MNDNVTEPVPTAPQEPGSGRTPDAPAAPAAPAALGAPPARPTVPLPAVPRPSVTSAQQPVPGPPASPGGPYAGPQGYPQAQHPYGGGRPGAAPSGTSAQGAAPSGIYTPGAAPSGTYAQGAAFGLQQAPPAPRKKRLWPTVVSTAAVTALLVGGGTALGTTYLLDDGGSGATSSSLAGLGRTNPVSIDSVSPAAWETVAAAVAPTVVAIDVTTASGEAQGSGVIYDAAGHIITNNHVVTGAKDDTVTVTLSDGRLYDAKIVGLDSSTDLAVVKIVDPPSDLAVAQFADSDAVVVGNAVMAVGNPLGLANTVTTGIVSAVARPVTTAGEGDAQSAVVTNAIQIDAAINPGNSGGPLFDAQGNVIGITSSIASLSSGSSQSGSIGLGFAIPSNQAKSVGDQLIAKGVAEHAFLGVTLSDSTATADGVTRRGALVHDVTAGSPADKAGIKADDVVVAIDGESVTGYEFLTAAVRERVAGEQATLTLVRAGAAQEVTVTFAAKAAAETPSTEEPGTEPGGEESTPDPEQMSPDELWEWFQENGR